jgi:CHAT domain-containing protein
VFIIRRLTSSGLLLVVLAGCNGKTPFGAIGGSRVIEPRLSIAAAWRPCKPILGRKLIQDVVCAPASTIQGCDKYIIDADAARQAVASRSPCLDRAIRYLQKASRQNTSALTDLAAAYYVRAQGDDRVLDLLRALNAAEEAAALRPVPPGAYFNLGLILQSLGLNRDAMDAWTRAAATETGEWAQEARAHRDALARQTGETAERQWDLGQVKITDALARNDEKAVEAVIAPFPFTAKRYFEDTLLPAWARGSLPLQQLKTFAMALAKTARDPYPRDIVASIESAAQSPTRLAALKKGCTTLKAAHEFHKALDVGQAVPPYSVAANLLKRGGSPLYLDAEIGRASTMLNEEGKTEQDSLTLFREIEAIARLRGYSRLEISAHSGAAYTLLINDRLIESQAAYEDALKFYRKAGDREGLASTAARLAGVLRLLGQYEEAVQTALPFVRDAANIIDFNSHHLLFGETAGVATLNGCPRSAFTLLNAEVRHFEDELKTIPPENRTLIDAVEKHIGYALENRAAAELQLGQYPQAESDLKQAARLTQQNEADRSHALEAQLDELLGMSRINTDPKAAAADLANAAVLDDKDYTFFRVAVLVEEAGALRRINKRAEAHDAIRKAVDEIVREETGTLAERKLQDAPIWNGYFDRFRNAYDLLIRQYLDEGDTDEAFAYNEQSHALEPLDLILRSAFAAPEVKKLAAEAPTELLRDIRLQLPPDTYVVEYRVLDDATYVWIVWHDGSRFLRLLPARSEVEGWTTTLQEAAVAGDQTAFASHLYAPYDRLITPVLAIIHPTANTRLVIVPDEFMHALPFAALRDPNSRRYLIQQATVSISGSAKLYVSSLLRDRALKSKGTTTLLVGDPAFDPRYGRGAPPLSAARAEVQELREIYPPRATVLIGAEATVPRFLQAARESQIVHVAAHAFTDGEAPSQSYLLLAPSGSDTGVLDAQKLLTALKLKDTRLVVLGACRSGGSVTVGPQGVGPLVRPFLAAGVPGVIGTLWDINDATAKGVLVSFHRHYRQGSDAAAALRAAQIELLNSPNPGLNSELQWAAYQVIGYASSPFAAAGEIKKEKPP